MAKSFLKKLRTDFANKRDGGDEAKGRPAVRRVSKKEREEERKRDAEKEKKFTRKEASQKKREAQDKRDKEDRIKSSGFTRRGGSKK